MKFEAASAPAITPWTFSYGGASERPDYLGIGEIPRTTPRDIATFRLPTPHRGPQNAKKNRYSQPPIFALTSLHAQNADTSKTHSPSKERTQTQLTTNANPLDPAPKHTNRKECLLETQQRMYLYCLLPYTPATSNAESRGHLQGGP